MNRLGLRQRNAALRWCLACLVFFLILSFVRADDTLVQKTGAKITGQITGVAGGQVTMKIKSPNGGVATIPYSLSDIASVDMAAPPELAQVKGKDPATVIAALDPLVKAYAGLPALWVIDAMGALADADSASGKDDAANAIYAQINQLYPNSPYTNVAVAGTAKVLLSQGKIDQALAAVQPVIDAANKNVAPSPSEGRAYAGAFLVEGQILEAQKKFPEALEAYLTVKTMFYQNSALADQAEKLVQNLRDKNPGVSVN